MPEKRENIRKIMKTLNGIDGAYNQISKLIGYKSNSTWVLYALDDGKRHTQKQIAKEWLIPPTTVNTIIKEFEMKGYVTLEESPENKRERWIHLTPQGKEYARKALDQIYAAENEAFNNTEGTEKLAAVLEELYLNIKNSFEKLEKTMLEEKEVKKYEN